MITLARADFRDPALATFLSAHLADMEPTAPPESRHALDLGALQRDGVRLWTAHADDELVGTVALADLAPGHAELKSMRTAPTHRSQGVASRLLAHALEDARRRGTTRVSLETGSSDFFAAARALYRRAGFIDTAPFGEYREDPHSVYLTTSL